jgi:Ni,Fe-hydrogenase III small subunit
MAPTLGKTCERIFIMLRILEKIHRIGIITEPLTKLDEPTLVEVGEQLKAHIGERFGGSLAIREVDAGSCNGCELEIQMLGNPYYSIERFGVHFVASPRFADMLLVTGPVSRHMEEALRRTLAATPEPRLVIAVGTCGANGGEFGESYASCGAVSNVIAVDAVIFGCPPTPISLMRGILEAIQTR